MRESGRAHDREEKIEVRWGLEDDEARIAELLELNGMRRTIASEERFIVATAKPSGKLLAALRYRTEPKRLLLGLLVSDPWAEERPLAVALYAGTGELAREMGAREVSAVRSCTPTTTRTKRVSLAVSRWLVPGRDALPLPPQRVARGRMAEVVAHGGGGRLAGRPRHTILPGLPRSRARDGRVETIEAEMRKSHVAGAEVDRLIGELEQEFDLLRLRDLKAGLEREDERLAEEERLMR